MIAKMKVGVFEDWIGEEDRWRNTKKGFGVAQQSEKSNRGFPLCAPMLRSSDAQEDLGLS